MVVTKNQWSHFKIDWDLGRSSACICIEGTDQGQKDIFTENSQ